MSNKKKSVDAYEFEKKVMDKLIDALLESEDGRDLLNDAMDKAMDELNIELQRDKANFIDGIYNVSKHYEH